MEANFSERSTSDDKCLALFKIAREEDIEIPDPRVHMYLSWVLEIPNDSNLQKTMSGFVVESLNDLERIAKENEKSISPNALPYLVARTTGAFVTSYNSLIGTVDDKDIGFPAACYSVAGYHGGKMGKKENSQLFGLMALNLDKYTDLLAKYHSRVRVDPNFGVTDKDFLDFRDYFSPKEKSTEIVISEKNVKSDDGLLI